MKRVIIAGGGVVGLSCAFYLREAGHEVHVIDRTDMWNSCAYGSAGYVCPSHFTPLAAPGLATQALKWMLNPRSPFYVKPTLRPDVIEWGWKFMRNSTKAHVERSAIPLRDLSLLSQSLYAEWNRLAGFDFAYEHAGLMEVFQTPEAVRHAEKTVKRARELGLDTELLSKSDVEKLEPDVKMNVAGGMYFKCDTHLYPDKLMRCLLKHLAEQGVQFHPNETITDFDIEGSRVVAVSTNTERLECDEVVLAAGVWSRELAAKMKLKIPMAGGRGYSVTFENSPYKINHPIVLEEARVAVTPMDGNKLRFGGTMEITSIGAEPDLRRVEGILQGVKRFFPEMDIPMPSRDQVWSGYRPCSADGLPYIGRAREYQNLTIATGHSMLGLSLGPATGKLVSEVIAGVRPSMEMGAFEPERFG